MRKFTQDFKKETVGKAIKTELTRKTFAKEVGVHPDTLRKWINTYKDEVLVPVEKPKKEFMVKIINLRTEEIKYLVSWTKKKVTSQIEKGWVAKREKTAMKYIDLISNDTTFDIFSVMLYVV